MSLFQCEICGCIENTACSAQGIKGCMESYFDFTGIEERKGKLLCSACAPTKDIDGKPTEFGRWHGKFKRKFLVKGMFKSNREGNLEHKETGETDLTKYVIEVEK